MKQRGFMMKHSDIVESSDFKHCFQGSLFEFICLFADVRKTSPDPFLKITCSPLTTWRGISLFGKIGISCDLWENSCDILTNDQKIIKEALDFGDCAVFSVTYRERENHELKVECVFSSCTLLGKRLGWLGYLKRKIKDQDNDYKGDYVKATPCMGIFHWNVMRRTWACWCGQHVVMGRTYIIRYVRLRSVIDQGYLGCVQECLHFESGFEATGHFWAVFFAPDDLCFPHMGVFWNGGYPKLDGL
jgi:hypothetical protein